MNRVWVVRAFLDFQTRDETEEGELGLLEWRQLQTGRVHTGSGRYSRTEAFKQIAAGQHRTWASQKYT